MTAPELKLDALVKPLVWTEESPNCWFGRGAFGYQRDFRVFDGVAKVRIGTIGARVTPDHARGFYDREYVEFVLEAIDREALTTIRAQLAEARAGNRALLDARDDMERCWREQKTRADRAEAERAAQIEADAGIADSFNPCAATAIRNQPHDRTALDAVRQAAKVEAWRKAGVATSGLATGHGCRAAILALIELEGV